jgi:hypothetical protein
MATTGNSCYILEEIIKNKHDLQRAGVKLEAQWAAPVSFTFHSASEKNRLQGACCHSPEMLGIRMLSFERKLQEQT